MPIGGERLSLLPVYAGLLAAAPRVSALASLSWRGAGCGRQRRAVPQWQLQLNRPVSTAGAGRAVSERTSDPGVPCRGDPGVCLAALVRGRGKGETADVAVLLGNGGVAGEEAGAGAGVRGGAFQDGAAVSSGRSVGGEEGRAAGSHGRSRGRRRGREGE